MFEIIVEVAQNRKPKLNIKSHYSNRKIIHFFLKLSPLGFRNSFLNAFIPQVEDEFEIDILQLRIKKRERL
ncbi:hypothetical protein DLM78_03465 [Leptospira stimsonii]|uniref:Uncharacterized protein n=1 Tax=Leptospira stimsonii TaxID=2202203 RepID=A0A8B3CXK4_9LEPT|nr:hypothetical protein DLM78_03465 [Leptospira stimsonii]